MGFRVYVRFTASGVSALDLGHGVQYSGFQFEHLYILLKGKPPFRNWLSEDVATSSRSSCSVCEIIATWFDAATVEAQPQNWLS